MSGTHAGGWLNGAGVRGSILGISGLGRGSGDGSFIGRKVGRVQAWVWVECVDSL